MISRLNLNLGFVWLKMSSLRKKKNPLLLTQTTQNKEKMGFCPSFKKKIQHFAQFLKLIKKMSMFWNSIFGQSSYNKLKIKKLKKKFLEPYSGILRSLIVAFWRPYSGVLELEFHANFFFFFLITSYL